MADPQVKVVITADAEHLTKGLQQAGNAVKGATQEMQGHIGGLEKALGSLLAPVSALLGALAGGALFKSAVDGTVAWTGQALKLQRALGGTTEEATVLAVAIDEIHGNVEDFLAGSSKLTKTLNKNEESIKSFGVETRDVNGHFRSTPDLISEINSRLGEFKQGTDRNAEAQKIYGRSYQEMLRYVKLTPEVMEEAREKAERLHLLVGPEGVEKTKAYRAALVDVDLVMESAKVRIGDQLLPKLTELGAWFSQVGPAAIETTLRVLRGIGEVLSYTSVQAGLAILVLRGPLTLVLSQAATFGTAMVQVFQRVVMGAQGPLSATASSLLGLLNPVTLVIAAVAVATIGLEYWSQASSRAAEAQRELANQSIESSRAFEGLSAEALRNDGIIRSGSASTEARKQAQDRLAIIIEQLKAAYPGFNAFLVDEAGHQRRIGEALKLQREEQIRLTEAKIADLKVNLEAAKAEVGGGLANLAPDQRDRGGWLDYLPTAALGNRALDSQTKAVKTLQKALSDLQTDLRGLNGETKAAFGDTSEGGEKSETELQRLKANLEAKKFNFEKEAQARGQFIEFSKAQEAQWLQENVGAYKLNAKERLEVAKMTFEAERAVGKQKFEGEIEGLKVSLEAAKLDGAARIRIAEEIAEKQATAYGVDSKQAKAAAIEVVRVKRDAADQTRKLNEEILANERNHDVAALDLEKTFVEELARRQEISELDTIQRLRNLEDQKFKIKEAELLEQVSLDGRTAAEEEKLWGQLQALRDAHKTSVIQSALEVDNELRKSNGMAGWLSGVQDYTRQAQNAFETFRQAALSVLSGVQNAFAQGIQGMLSGQMNLAQGMKTIWKGIVSTIIGAVAQMIAQWAVAAIAEKIFGVQSAASAVARAGVETSASLTAGAAGAWEAYGWMPFVGAGLATAQILAMEASVAAVKAAPIVAHAVGGIIDQPTLALMGEAGREVVAPEKDFKAWASGLVGLGSALAGNIAGQQSQAFAYQTQAAGFSQGVPAPSGAPGHPPMAFDLRGAMFLGSESETRRLFADMTHKALQDRDRRNG